jgi:UrcA family protein
MKRIIGTLIAISSVAAAGQPPVVIKSGDQPTMEVGFSDLNLATYDGESALRHRVGSAVAKVCLESVGPRTFLMVEQSCRIYAWHGALPQIERAVRRAHELASTGHASITAASISITAP